MSKTTDGSDLPVRERVSLEGYLEYSEPVSLQTTITIRSIASPTSHGDEASSGAPDTGAPTPTDQTDQEQNSIRNLPVWKKRSLFAGSCCLQFLLQFDVAAVAVTIPKIAKDENAPQYKAFALATVYCLAQTVFQLVFSHVSHALGRKLMYLGAVMFYLVGAMIGTNKVPVDALIGARFIQGIGAAGMFTMSAIVIVDMTQPRQRAGWTSLSQALGASGNICGPLFAGLMFTRYHKDWNVVFFFEAVFAAVLLVNLYFLLPWDVRSRRDTLRQLKGCDWIGMGLFFACAILILVPINIGGTTSRTEWKSPTILALFSAGFISLAALIYHQRYRAKRPAFPREVFASRTTAIAFLGNAVCGILLFTVFYTLVLFWEGVRQKSETQVGIVLLSVTLTYPVAFAITGIAIRRWGRVRQAIAAGVFLSVLSLGLMQLMDENGSEAALVFICVIAGAGCGVFAPAMVNAVIATTESRWHSHAIATRSLVYTAGQCMGVSLGMAIFSAAFKVRLSAGIAQLALRDPQELMSRLDELRKLAPGGELVSMFVGALRWVWAFACILAGITGVLAIWSNCPDLPEDITTVTAVADEEPQPNGIAMSSRQ